jgi:hypothetical protein
MKEDEEEFAMNIQERNSPMIRLSRRRGTISPNASFRIPMPLSN